MGERCPDANESCKYWDSKHGCRTNIHHLYWPARDYKTPIEKEFRELPDNKVALCMSEHDDLHRTEQPPQMPEREVMLIAIHGVQNVKL